MKITESQLKRIILEETKVIVKELSRSPSSFEKVGHTALDVAGVAGDVFFGSGALFDAANAAWYMKKGDYFNAGLSAISILPFAGDLVGKGTKLEIALAKAGKAGKQGRLSRIQKSDVGRGLAKHMPKIIAAWDLVSDRFGDEDAEKMLEVLKNASGTATEEDIEDENVA